MAPFWYETFINVRNPLVWLARLRHHRMVRERLVDMALIGGLVIICLVFIFIIISPGRTPFTQSTPQAVATPASEPETSVAQAPVEPTEPNGITPVAPGADMTNDTQVAVDTEDEADTGTTEPEVEAPPLQPLPAGSFELERVGFSFVTGGAGACNIILEPWQHVAVSRDILAEYPCGSEVQITLDDTIAGRQQFTAIVADTMGTAFSRTVNIYIGEDEPAQQYGIRTGQFSP